MSIVNPNAVLILGAGASAQFNLPVGGSLLDDIAVKIEKELKVRQREFQDYGSNGITRQLYGGGDRTTPLPYSYVSSPISSTYLLQKSAGNQPNHEILNELIKEAGRAVQFLQNQTADTIDAFIAENPTISDIVKIAIANIFFEKLYTQSDAGNDLSWTLNPLGIRKLKGERNWIHLLINLIRHGYSDDKITPDNRIKIITFNYDTILEKVLSEAFGNTEKDLPHWADLIEIEHMHGCMPLLEDEVADPHNVTIEMAKAIEVATERNPRAEVVRARANAARWIAAANDIYACGFAFAGPNCKLIGLDGPRRGDGTNLRYCNFNGNPGVKNSAGRYGVFDPMLARQAIPPLRIITEDAPHDDQVLSITNWFYRGSPGELPA